MPSAAAGKRLPKGALVAEQPPFRMDSVTLGDPIQACDRYGQWYNAKVVDERGEGANRKIKVHFPGWSKRQDEWAGGDRLRAVSPHRLNLAFRDGAFPRLLT